jgi:hypothetical protein
MPSRALLMWRVPRSKGLRADYAGQGRLLAEIVEYKPTEALTQPLVMHRHVKRSALVKTDPGTLTNMKDTEISQALLFARALNVVGYNAVVLYEETFKGRPLSDTEKELIAARFGVVTHNETAPDYAAATTASRAFASRFVDTVFQATYNEKTNVSSTNSSLQAFGGPQASLVTGRQRDRGNSKQKEVNRQQLTLVSNILRPLAHLIESRKETVFAVALNGANPFKAIDIVYI